MREKTCIVCSTRFTPLKPMQKACSAECAIKYAIEKRDKARAKAERVAQLESRKVIKLRKEAIKTRSDYIKEAQIAVNAYVRERDKGKTCISCSTLLGSGYVGGGFDAGHYRSRGSAPHLRFDARNIHGQCKRCNRYLSGNVNSFRIGLVARFGLAYVEELESDNTPRKLSIEELKQIKAEYKRKLKELQHG